MRRGRGGRGGREARRSGPGQIRPGTGTRPGLWRRAAPLRPDAARRAVVSRPLRRQGAPTRGPGLSGRPASRDLLRRGAPGRRRRALRVAKPAAQAAALSGGGGSVGSGGRRAAAVRRANLRMTPPCLRREGRGLRGWGAGEGGGSVWSGPPGISRSRRWEVTRKAGSFFFLAPFRLSSATGALARLAVSH